MIVHCFEWVHRTHGLFFSSRSAFSLPESMDRPVVVKEVLEYEEIDGGGGGEGPGDEVAICFSSIS